MILAEAIQRFRDLRDYESQVKPGVVFNRAEAIKSAQTEPTGPAHLMLVKHALRDLVRDGHLDAKTARGVNPRNPAHLQMLVDVVNRVANTKDPNYYDYKVPLAHSAVKHGARGGWGDGFFERHFYIHTPEAGTSVLEDPTRRLEKLLPRGQHQWPYEPHDNDTYYRQPAAAKTLKSAVTGKKRRLARVRDLTKPRSYYHTPDDSDTNVVRKGVI